MACLKSPQSTTRLGKSYHVGGSCGAAHRPPSRDFWEERSPRANQPHKRAWAFINSIGRPSETDGGGEELDLPGVNHAWMEPYKGRSHLFQGIQGEGGQGRMKKENATERRREEENGIIEQCI